MTPNTNVINQLNMIIDSILFVRLYLFHKSLLILNKLNKIEKLFEHMSDYLDCYIGILASPVKKKTKKNDVLINCIT